MDRQGGATYTVDWSGQGYEQLMQQMRDFLNLKRQVDAAVRQGIGGGAQAPNVSGATIGTPVGATTSREAAAAQRVYERALRQEAQHHERVARDAQRQQQRAESADFAQRLRQTSGSQQEPSVFGAVSAPVAGASDEQWAGYLKAIKDRQEEALKNNEELNQADRRILSNANQIGNIMSQRKAAEERAAEGGIINKLVGVAGSIGPSQLYYAQMALGPWGLGLGPFGIAAGLGLGAVGALGMGVLNTTASQLQVSRMVAGILPSTNGVAVAPADMALADQLTQTGAGFGLSRQDVFSLLPAAAAFNLSGPNALNGIITGGLTRAAQGQLTNEQGVQLQGLVTSRTNGDVAEASRQFVLLNQAIKDTGANIHTVYGDILAQGAALKSGTNLAGFAAVDAALKGTGLSATDLIGGGTQSSGVQRLAQAAAFNMSESSFMALQQDPQAFAQRLQQYTRGLMGQTGSPSATEAVLQAQGFIQGGQNADEVLKEILAGNFQLPKTGAPPNKQQLDQQVAKATVDAMAVNTLTLPVMSRVGLAGQTAMAGITDLVNGRGVTPAVLQTAQLAATVTSALDKVVTTAMPLVQNGPAGAAEHLLTIVLQDAAGNLLGQFGYSTQTRTTTPGQGPSANVGIVAPRTPNSTNTNGR